MSREFITQLYLLTPLWLWPVLWVEIYWMQARLDRLLDADDPRDLYEVQLNDWGQLKLVKIYTHIDVPDPDHWRPDARINSDLFASELHMSPHLRRMPESQASAFIWLVHDSATPQSRRSRLLPGIRMQGEDALYLDPG